MTAAVQAPPAATADQKEDTPFAKAIRSLSFRLDPEQIGAGPLAELRRMDPLAPVLPPAFWTLLFEHDLDDLRSGDRAERAFAVVLNGMALMAPKPHEGGKDPKRRWEHSAGAVLARTGYSEPRFIRLLRADHVTLALEIGAACRWLRAKGETVNWIGFARFILARLTAPDGETAEDLTHRLSRDYFRALSKSKSEDAAP